MFEGEIELDAAETVCGPASELGQEVVDGLLSLADQSLIRVIESAEQPRFEMLDTIREFAGEMLERSGDRAELERRHAAWYLDFTQRGAAELTGDDQRRWLERFEEAHDNIRIALDRAIARSDAATTNMLAFNTWRFWQKRGHLYEARRRLDAIAATPWSREDPVLRARLVEALGGVAWWQGDIPSMKPAYAEAVEIWRRIGNQSELANALYNYSFAYTVPESDSQTEPDPTGEGREALQEALKIYRAIGDEHGEANVLWGIGNMLYFKNEIDPGSVELAMALEKFRRTGDRTMEAWSEHMLGGALIRLNRLDEARDHLVEALRHFYRSSDTAGVTLAFDDLAGLAIAEGEVERGARLWGAARSLSTTTGTGLATLVEGSLNFQMRPNVRQAIDPELLAGLAREGAAMTLDEIVAYALRVPVSALADLPDRSQVENVISG